VLKASRSSIVNQDGREMSGAVPIRMLLRLVFDTAALRRIVYPACGAFAELIYSGGSSPNYEQHEEQ